MSVLLWALAAVTVLDTILLVVLLLRRVPDAAGLLAPRLEALERLQERTERGLRDELARGREEATSRGRDLREEVTGSLTRLSEATVSQLEAVRRVIEERLIALQVDNAQKLESMRQTVDEKLQGTLEKRLSESFSLVSERLEQVQKGLGEMQSLATGVGDLKKVLTNVKTRGTWGEIQLGTQLEQVLTPTQYATNVATRPGSGERVEFAIRLPGRGDDARDVVWLPIDAKFPQEDYLRLVEAQEAGDAEAMDAAIRQLELRIRASARDICEKYLSPPATTDFAILYLPTEGLYAEVLRRTALVEAVRREFHVEIAGPTTLGALLSSLQMGLRTLAIQQRSSEVWSVLGQVKNEFEKFGGILDKVKKKLQEASNVVDAASTRSRAIQRSLRDVEALPVPDGVEAALPPGLDLDEMIEFEGAGVE